MCARAGEGARVEKALREILAHRVLLPMTHDDLRAADERDAAGTHAGMQMVLPPIVRAAVSVAVQQHSGIEHVVPREPRGRPGGQRREAVAVLAQEGGPVDDALSGRILHGTSHHDRARRALCLAECEDEVAGPVGRHDHVILDHGDVLAARPVERQAAHGRDGGIGRRGHDAHVGKSCAHSLAYRLAEAIDDDRLDGERAPLPLECRQRSREVVEAVHAGHHNRDVDARSHREVW